MTAKHSRLAGAVLEAMAPFIQDFSNREETLLNAIDRRLEKIREVYLSLELAQCPIVTHHPSGPCAFCNTAAMREFLLLTQGKDVLP